MSRDRALTVGTVVLCGLLLAAGATLRLNHVNWDQFQQVHPDERFIVWVADTITWPGDLASALDPARSTINPLRWPPGAGDLAGKPRGYAYGHFPLYLLVITAHAAQSVGVWLGETTLAFPSFFQPLHAVGRHLAEYRYLALVGRALSAFCDLGTLVLIYLLGRRAYGRAAGLLAAGAYAFAVLPIQLSHFYAVDMVLSFCVVATVALAARWAEGEGGWLSWLLAGVMYGLAVGSKFSAVLLLLPLVAAALHRLPAGDGRHGFTRAARRLAPVLGVAFLTFLLTNPFAILEFPAYVKNVLAQNAMVTGLMDAPYTRQYAGTVPYWYFIRQLSQWGLGWPLGLAGWAGLVWAVVKVVKGRAPSAAQAIILTWALPYFLLTGGFYAKFLRYMAPLVPFLLICAAGMAVDGTYRWLVARWQGRGRVVWAIAASGVMLFTIGWALAFTGVYQQEHPWIQASRWIYDNIPEGRYLLTEHWDDALPLTLDEISPRPEQHTYDRVELPLYEPDTREKLDTLVGELSKADYLIVASNRLYAPIQRLARRYPMASQYYRLLFMGGLGYRQVATFSAYPRLDGLVVPDDHADESFTVYDHPRVMIFENVERLKPELLRARLERYLPLRTSRLAPDRVITMRFLSRAEASRKVPGHARYALPQAPEPGAPLTLSQPVDTLPVVADFRWNRVASENTIVAVTLWWFVLSLLGWLVWPVLFPLMSGLRDRGYGLARTAGWLLVGWVHWLGVSITNPFTSAARDAASGQDAGFWQNRAGMIAIVVAGLAIVGLVSWWVQRKQINAFWAQRRRLLLGEEALFAASFLAFVGIRVLNPDLWQPWNGGEKFMEFAFLNATLRSAHFPPYDPYFAGGVINYYYYGLYLVSVLIKLTGIASEVAFNLAVPALFALTATGLFSVGVSLAQRIGSDHFDRSTGLELAEVLQGCTASVTADTQISGPRAMRPRGNAYAAAGLGVVLALLMSNLSGFSQLFDNLVRLGGGHVDAEVSLLERLLVSGRGLGQLLQGVPLPGYDYWAPSRVMPFTINEFPFWTFLFADLHPHLIALPFGVLVVGLILNWVLAAEATHLPTKPRSPDPVASVADTVERQGGAARSNPFLRPLQDVLKVCLIIIGLGAMAPINTWDLPTYWCLVMGGLLLAGWRRRRLTSVRSAAGLRELAGALALAGLVGALAVAAYWPFYATYQARVGAGGDAGLGRYLGWTSEASPLKSWLTVWGFFIFLAFSFTALGAWRWLRGRYQASGANRPAETPDIETMGGSLPSDSDKGTVAPQGSRGEADLHQRRPRLWLVGLLALWGVVALLIALGRPTAALAAVPLCLALALMLRAYTSAEDAFTYWLVALGMAIVAGLELIYLRDFLDGGEWYRMNTVFKFSMPAWLFLGLAGGVSLGRVWSGAREVSGPPGPDVSLQRDDEPSRGATPRGGAPVWRVLWRIMASVLLAAGLVFLFFGTVSRIQDRFPGARPPVGTLDGTAYMMAGKYTWPNSRHVIDLAYDYLAIHWLLDHVSGTPVVAEAPAGSYVVDGASVGYDYYRAGGLRVASMTGFPTFVGQHQYEQRPGDQVGERTAQGQEFFSTTDVARARELMRDLRVGYIYVGPLERILFTEESLRKFDVMVEMGDLEVVYRNPGVTIYRAASFG